MKIKSHVRLFVYLFTLVLLCSCNESKKERPNVILITADDLGKQLNIYGDSTIATPHLSKLAERGMVFQKGYVTQASCSSSRSSILTGLYPHSNGQVGLAHRGFSMNRSYENISSVLKVDGYKTGIIGKLHVNPEEAFVWDYSKKNYEEARDVELVKDRAEDFINTSGTQPFFLYLNYTDPHVPFHRDYKGYPSHKVTKDEVSAFDFQGIDDDEQLQRIADYYCCVKRLDEGVGLLMNMLKRKKLLDNTIIIFIGDHGAPFTRGKAACYEASVNIPYFVSYPQTIKPNLSSEAVVSTVDILPTICQMVGSKIPDGLQGKSLLPILECKKNNVRDYLFTEFNFHVQRKDHFYPRRTVTDGRYKLVLNQMVGITDHNDFTSVDGCKAYKFSRGEKYEKTWVRTIFDRFRTPPKVEFYDLDHDSNETIDLSEHLDYQEKKEELLHQLYQWMERTNDPYFSEMELKSTLKRLTMNE